MVQTLIAGQYDWKLVALSITIAICASYAALDLAGRTANSKGRSRALWTSGGATAMGLGIWAMHYIGMLAFRLPVPVFYNVPVVAFSLFAAIASSAIALIVLSRKDLSKRYLAGGSLVMGGGIAAMHYSGMAAMRMPAHQIYNPSLVALSVAIAVAVSYAALSIAYRLRDPARDPGWIRLAAAAVMGFAIAAMHYTGMAAVCFQHVHMAAVNDGQSVSVSGLGITGIAAVTFAVLALSLIGSLADRNFSRQREMLHSEQERWRLVMTANQDGLFDSDLVTGKVFFSPRWSAILGYGPGELAPTIESWRERIHPEDRENVEATLDKYFQDRQGTSETEYRLRHRDGSWRWILARAQAIWDENGRAVRLVGSNSDITERKKALAALKSSEARFSAFMDQNPGLCFIKDADGRFLYTNRTLEQKWNLKPGEWIGKLDREIWPASRAEKVREDDLAVLAAGSPSEFTAAVEAPDGVLRQFLSTKFSFPDVDGRQCIGGVAVDITERVQSEEKLRASERRYRELFERNPVPSWIYSISDRRILDVNEAAIDHYGWPREKFLGLSLDRIRMPGQSDAVEAELRECSRLHKRTNPLGHRRNNKSNIWVEVSGHELEMGGCSARIIMANDVTARIAAEDEIKRTNDQLESLVAQRTTELQTSYAKWRSLVEALPQFVWSTRTDGFCDYLSNQWEQFTGVPSADLLGSGWLETLHPVDRPRVESAWLSAVATNGQYEIEYRIRSRDGSYRWFMARGRPVSAVGVVTHWLGTSTDIEDQKRSEERLESAVAERTSALAEARDRAECATQAKSSFLAAMSHEIRTPMNGVIGMTNLMLDTPLTSEQCCYLDTIRSSGQALLTIINDVLDFSKIEAGKMELENLEFDLQTLLEESVELMNNAANAKGLRLSLNVADGVPFCAIGDSGRLRQILLNLLSNAVKFTGQGSVSLSVSRSALQDQIMTLRFAVRDTGIGLTPTQQAGLFQAFAQADPSTTRRFGGTGLGLSIAKRLVELMGGTIGVSSQVSEGTTFWFNICLNLPTAAAMGALRGRALLIDDNDSRNIVRRYLERAGMVVLESALGIDDLAGPGEAGTQTSSALPISVVLIDATSVYIQAEIKRLRGLPGLGKCPVLVLGTPSDGLGAGGALPSPEVAVYVPKPIRAVPLLRAVQLAIRGGLSQSLDWERVASAPYIKGAEILLVEDNRVNQKIARLMLEKLGCRVAIAANGREACEALERRPYDLVFMDCQMPEMDGFEATRIIRQRELGRSRTPIIALTAGVMKEERDQCYAAGMDDFLSKPIASRDLEASIENWLRARSAVPPAPQLVPEGGPL